MIQDIYPHSFDIEYKNIVPDIECKIIFLSEKKIYVLEKESLTDFPTYQEIDNKLLSINNLQYLFSLDGIKFFRCHLDKVDDIESLYQKNDGVWKTRHEMRQTKPKEITLAAITAMHLDGWYESSKYCGACGEKTVHDEKERMMRCPCCNNMIFPRINPAVIVGVTKGDEILLTKYRGREYTNYALIAGFTEIGESFEQTVSREVMEEAGLKVKNIRYYKSQPWGFADNILAGYYCEVDGDSNIKMDDEELSVAEWVKRSDIPDRFENLSLTHEMIMNFKVDKV